jgi:hypothetical protein
VTDLEWLVGAAWEVVISAGDHQGGAAIRVGLDDGSLFWDDTIEGALAQARRHSERQNVTP